MVLIILVVEIVCLSIAYSGNLFKTNDIDNFVAVNDETTNKYFVNLQVEEAFGMYEEYGQKYYMYNK